MLSSPEQIALNLLAKDLVHSMIGCFLVIRERFNGKLWVFEECFSINLWIVVVYFVTCNFFCFVLKSLNDVKKSFKILFTCNNLPCNKYCLPVQNSLILYLNFVSNDNILNISRATLDLLLGGNIYRNDSYLLVDIDMTNNYCLKNSYRSFM